jgi:hypothetical protein
VVFLDLLLLSLPPTLPLPLLKNLNFTLLRPLEHPCHPKTFLNDHFLTQPSCGFGSPTKLASLKRLLLKIKPDIVFLQETLVHGDKAKNLFLQCLPQWNVVSLDPIGHSRGLLTGWNPIFAEFCAFGTTAGIFLEGRVKLSKDPIKLLNCYAPYKDREPFWKKLFDSGFLCEDNLIIGGDLKFHPLC